MNRSRLAIFFFFCGTVCLYIVGHETPINAFELPEDYDMYAAFAESDTWYEDNRGPISSEKQATGESVDASEMKNP
ncbi:MAG TPA: hypothetical protein PKH10_07565 [bacterium]|nr:hypothetical protein [bacterium]